MFQPTCRACGMLVRVTSRYCPECGVHHPQKSAWHIRLAAIGHGVATGVVPGIIFAALAAVSRSSGIGFFPPSQTLGFCLMPLLALGMFFGAQSAPKSELAQRKASMLGGVVAAALGFWPVFIMSPTHQKILGSFNVGLTSVASIVVMSVMLRSTGMFDTAKKCWRRQEAEANAAFEHQVRIAREVESSCAAAERNEQLNPDDAAAKAIASAARELLEHGREAQARARASAWSVYACRWEHIAACLVERIEHLTLAELAARLAAIEAERQKSARLIQSWRGEAAAIEDVGAEKLAEVEGLRSNYFTDAVNLVLAQRIHTAVSGGSNPEPGMTAKATRADLETLREHVAAVQAWREVETGTQEPGSKDSGRPISGTGVAGVDWNDAFDWAGVEVLSTAPDTTSPEPEPDVVQAVELEPPSAPAATPSRSPELQAFIDALYDLYLDEFADRVRSLLTQGTHLQPPFRNWHMFTTAERTALMRGLVKSVQEAADDPHFADDRSYCLDIITLAEMYIADAPARDAVRQLDVPHLNVFADIIEALPTPADIATLCQALQAPQVGAVPQRFRELYSRWHALSHDGRVRLIRYMRAETANRAKPGQSAGASANITRALASLEMLEAQVISWEELGDARYQMSSQGGEAGSTPQERKQSTEAKGYAAGEISLRNSRSR